MLKRMRPRLLCLALFSVVPLHAAIVRGHVTTALGVPLPGARVQLIRLTGGTRAITAALTGPDGSYELRTDLGGRFLLLTSSPMLNATVDPQLSPAFYAGRGDLLTRNIALDPSHVTPQTSAVPNGHEQPLAQISTPLSQILPPAFIPQATILPELHVLPSVFIVQLGQTGTPAALYLRGASPDAVQLTLDGTPIEDFGGGFNLSTLAATGFDGTTPNPALELLPTPQSQRDAEAGLLALHTATSSTTRTALTYSGDAGPLTTYRNEVTLAAAPRRADLTAAFSRFNTANELSPYHLATAVANLGYAISAGTSLRLSARRDVDASAYTLPFDLFHLAPIGKQANQNLFGTFVFSTTTAGNWHNAATYGLVRRRSELFIYSHPTVGSLVTVTGANGSSITGTAAAPILLNREDTITDRDVATFQSDRPIKSWLYPSVTLRYESEHAADIQNQAQTPEVRVHFAATFALTGEIRHRIFYETSGFVDDSPTNHLTGAPRIGLTYAPVRAGSRKFRGTTLHTTFAASSREPTPLEHTVLSPRTRTAEASVDQVILPRKLTVRATYFHNQFSHQFEQLAQSSTFQTLAYRTQGLESQVTYNPEQHLNFSAGYTYLASFTERSAALTGLFTAVQGARPFHRPPNSGFVTATYAGARLTASIKAAIAGRSDDSTQVVSLQLPNRNLSPGYTSMDASATYNLTPRFAIYTQLTNLFDNRHMAPIGYTTTPFVARTGLRFRLRGD